MSSLCHVALLTCMCQSTHACGPEDTMMMKKTFTAAAVASLATAAASSALPPELREPLARPAPRDAYARSAMDTIYEISLKTTMQIIALP